MVLCYTNEWVTITLLNLMDTKLSQQNVLHSYENGLIKAVLMIPMSYICEFISICEFIVAFTLLRIFLSWFILILGKGELSEGYRNL